MRRDQVQLFKDDYAIVCATFGCGERGVSFIGRPDAPPSLHHTLCEKCTGELIESITGLKGRSALSGTVEIPVDEFEDLKTKAAAWNEHASQLTTIVGDGKDASFITSDAAGFRLQADKITLTTGATEFEGEGKGIYGTEFKVDRNPDAPQTVLDAISLTPGAGEVFPSETNVSGAFNASDKLKDDELGEVDYDIDAMLEAARTHAELDKIVADLGLTNVPEKENGAGVKVTMNARKEAILSNFEGYE